MDEPAQLTFYFLHKPGTMGLGFRVGDNQYVLIEKVEAISRDEARDKIMGKIIRALKRRRGSIKSVQQEEFDQMVVKNEIVWIEDWPRSS